VKNRKSFSSGIMESASIKPGKATRNLTATDPVVAEVTTEERHHLICEAAYYRAERRSFAPGNELEDWLNAEAEIESMLTNPSAETMS